MAGFFLIMRKPTETSPPNDYAVQAVLWCTESFAMKSTLEEHSQWITDVRFSPNMSRLATCSADKTVRVWNTDNVSLHILCLLFFCSSDFVFESIYMPKPHIDS